MKSKMIKIENDNTEKMERLMDDINFDDNLRRAPRYEIDLKAVIEKILSANNITKKEFYRCVESSIKVDVYIQTAYDKGYIDQTGLNVMTALPCDIGNRLNSMMFLTK